jgi:hydroxypyruvate reductase
LIRSVEFLRKLFEVAVAAGSPEGILKEHLPDRPRGRTVVLGAGKAAASMARALEKNWPWPLEGLVVTPYGYSLQNNRIEVIEAAHPLPDAAGMEVAERMLELASGLGPEDLAVCLISGGGSALLVKPAPPLTLGEKRSVTDALLRCGASIAEINVVRKHLSGIKGGRLAAACHPARVVTLAISDVPGDDPSTIASGPTVPDPSTCGEALSVLKKYSIIVSDTILSHVDSDEGETPKPGDSGFSRDEFRMVATPGHALDVAASHVKAAGYTPLILGDALEGEAREVGRMLAGIALKIKRDHRPIAPPCVVLSGGETTVTVRGTGRGGRNTELQLAIAIALEGEAGIWALAADTDGIDGSGDNAGALVVPDTLSRAREKGLNPEAYLADNNAYGFFEALGDLVFTGPTRTNVNDFRAIVIDSGGPE